MAKRSNETTRANGGTTTVDAMEQRVVAFCRAARANRRDLQAKAEGWMNREALTKQIASVRDGATELLEQLAGSATKASKRAGPPRRRSAKRKGAAAAWSTPPQEKLSADADRSGREQGGQLGRQNADGKDDGQDEPAPPARPGGTTSGALFNQPPS